VVGGGDGDQIRLFCTRRAAYPGAGRHACRIRVTPARRWGSAEGQERPGPRVRSASPFIHRDHL